MLLPLDGPSKQDTLSVTTLSVVEVKADTTALSERKVVTIQGDGKFYLYFNDGGSAPSVSDLQNDGLLLFKNVLYTYEATDTQALYVLSVSGTVNLKVVERA